MSNTHREQLYLGRKLAVLSCTIALLTSVLISGFYVYHNNVTNLKNGMDHLMWQTRFLVPNIRNGFVQMQRDAYLLARLPAISEYSYFPSNANAPDAPTRTPEELRLRITRNIQTVMKLHPYYTQIQFIGLGNDGMEIIRVNATSNGSEAVPEDKLQKRGDEPYFKESLNLKEGQSYFSRVSYSRENGVISPEHRLTINQVLPVFNKEKELYGFIVINADYYGLLQSGIDNINNSNRIFITNESGDYTFTDSAGKFQKINFHEDKEYKENPLFQKLQIVPISEEVSLEASFDGDDKIISYIKLPLKELSVNAENRFIGIALLESKENFMENQRKALRQSLIMAGISVCLSLLFAWPIAVGAGKHFQNLLLRLTEIEASERKAHEELRAIVENAADGLITITKNGLIQSINPACEKLFGYSANELIGNNIKMLMPDKYAVHHDQYLNNYQTTHDAKMIGIGREVEGKKKNGDIFPLDLSVTEIKIDDAVFYSGVVRDISERKKAEDALKASNEALLKSNAELDDFAYIASHDLKEPLRAIYNHSRFLMEDHGDTLSSDAVSRLSSLLDASKRMDKLIDDLLNFSRLSRSEVSQVEVDMNEVVQDVVRNISAYLEECNGKVIIGQYLPPVVCDEVRAFSIFHNLIINAMKYNDHQEKIVNIGYKAEHVHDGTLVKDVYFVKDNGIGIDEKFKESVFRIFKRLNSSTAYGEGSGAGLTFTKKNVERHGGIIWFESVKGQGTVFYFTLKNAQD
jgi:PAS domain S-box-containing protein